MKLEEVPLENELKQGLIKYARDNNTSPFSLLESLVEDFLIKKEYLVICDSEEPVEFPTAHPIRNMFLRENGKFQVMKFINGKKINFMSGTYDEAKTAIDFLKRNGWDIKYSTSETKLRGKKQIDFLFNEIEKEKELKE